MAWLLIAVVAPGSSPALPPGIKAAAPAAGPAGGPAAALAGVRAGLTAANSFAKPPSKPPSEPLGNPFADSVASPVPQPVLRPVAIAAASPGAGLLPAPAQVAGHAMVSVPGVIPYIEPFYRTAAAAAWDAGRRHPVVAKSEAAPRPSLPAETASGAGVVPADVPTVLAAGVPRQVLGPKPSAAASPAGPHVVTPVPVAPVPSAAVPVAPAQVGPASGWTPSGAVPGPGAKTLPQSVPQSVPKSLPRRLPKSFPLTASTVVPSSPMAMLDASTASDVLHMIVGRSLVLSMRAPLQRIYVGDPKVLQSFASGVQEDVVTARSAGVSSLILWDEAGRRRAYTIFADVDTDGLTKAIGEALPDAQVVVAAKSDRLYLSGTVTSAAAGETLARLAANFSKTVINGVRVIEPHTKQIELKLRIVEVDRSRLQQFGLNFFAFGGSTQAGTTTQQFSTTIAPGPPATISDPLNLLLYSAKLNAGVTIKDLEQKQVLQVLAEPTLTTMSGLAARFLSGGEFPLPVVQGGTGNSTAITIVWKPYGVKVEFTPTANPDGTIRLKVAPEVSTLDYTNAVTVSGFVIPALSTRKAETEVELQDGQSFIISGLLDHRTSDNLSRMPGIASVPILGQLFRSKGLTLSTVDLVVLVTATVVNPLAPPAAVEEPKRILPYLDKQRFDEDLRREGQRHRPPAPAPDSPVSSLPSNSIQGVKP